MAGIRPTLRGDGKPHPKFRYWYKNWKGERKWGTGTEDPEYTQALADSLEARDAKLRRQIELGLATPPTSAELAKSTSIIELIDEYHAWGEAQGGRGGRPWGRGHAHMRKTHLKYWREKLGLKTVADLGTGLLPRVEKTLRELLAGGDAGKTVQNKSEAIRALCLWAKARGYLNADPLDGLAAFDTTPVNKRGVLLCEHIRPVLDAATDYDRILYEVAITTGLRVAELTALELHHFDVARSGLKLEARWTKNRKPGFQPLPRELADKLQAWTKTGRASELYGANPRAVKGKRGLSTPANPLLFVSAHPAKALKADMEAAKVNAWGGKIDFHSLRHTFVTLLHDCGASFAEAQVLARHSAKGLTDGVYTHVREERLAELVEKVWSTISGEKCAIRVQQKAAGAEQLLQPVLGMDFKGSLDWRARRDSNPRPSA